MLKKSTIAATLGLGLLPLAAGAADYTPVTQERLTNPEPENFFGKLQVVGHPQFGKADVGAVEISDDVENKYQGQDAPCDLAAKRGNCCRAERISRTFFVQSPPRFAEGRARSRLAMAHQRSIPGFRGFLLLHYACRCELASLRDRAASRVALRCHDTLPFSTAMRLSRRTETAIPEQNPDKVE